FFHPSLPTTIYTLSLHDALPIYVFVNRVQFAPRTHWIGPLLPYREIRHGDIMVFLSPAEPGLYVVKRVMGVPGDRIHLRDGVVRSEEHTSELQSLAYLVCRLLLE